MKKIVVLSLVIFASACKGNQGNATVPTPADAAPAQQLPNPYGAVHLGMAEAELLALFPPSEDLKTCGDVLAGQESPRPPEVPGAEDKSRSACLRAGEMAGFGVTQLAAVLADDVPGNPSGDALADYVAGVMLAGAQLRGALRAGALADTLVFEAAHGESSTTYGAVEPVAVALANGSFTFAKDSSGRRAMCATISEDCADFDPVRLAKFENGGYSLGALDEEAHSRVVYGKCRGAYLAKEKSLRYRFVKRTGGLAGVGLARGSRADHAIDPTTATTFALFTDRSHMSAGVAKVGATVANAAGRTHDYWQGAFVIHPSKSPGETPWGVAMVWLESGTVVRVLVNIQQDKTLGDLPNELVATYGPPASTTGTTTMWRQPGAEVDLDIGGRAALDVHRTAAQSPAK